MKSPQQFCEINAQTLAHLLPQSLSHRFIFKPQIPQVLPKSKANTELMLLQLFRASLDTLSPSFTVRVMSSLAKVFLMRYSQLQHRCTDITHRELSSY